MKLKTFLAALAFFGLVSFAHGVGFVAPAPLSDTENVVSAHRFYKEVSVLSIQVPTVVEIPFMDEFLERFDFAVLDTTTNSFEPYYFKQEGLNTIPLVVSTNPAVSSAGRMNDNNARTYADFPLPENAQGHVQIRLTSAVPVTSSVVTVLLDNNVALPNFVEIRAEVDEQMRIVVANRRMDQQTIRFPQTTSTAWTIDFTFGQPLRISELQLHQDNAAKPKTRALRFLAQPAHAYRVYFDPDRPAEEQVGESGNLASPKDILKVSASSSQNNPLYRKADVDGDGVPDTQDNCVSTSNADQQDVNENGRGDVCDDFDQDGLVNSKDNCPNNPNRGQIDTDGDGAGDVCDGEESRITEKYAWIPWVGIGFAVVVLIGLFALTARGIVMKPPSVPPEPPV